MKIFKVLMILLISSFSYYGVVNDDGEKVTNIQEIMQEQSNEIVAETVAIEQEEKNVKEVDVEIEKEKCKEEIVQEQKVETKKVESKPKNEQTVSKTETIKKATQKQEEKTEKEVEKAVEEKVVETVKTEIPKQEEKEIEQEVKIISNADKCASGNHGMGVGNSGKWFATKDEAIATYRAEIKIWGDKWTDKDNPISDEDYYANCPYGYEVWTCPYCNLWTLNYYYDK